MNVLQQGSAIPDVSDENIQVIKEIVRDNGELIEEYVDYLVSTIAKVYPDRRRKLFFVIDYLFNRSHAFRVCVIEKIDEIFYSVLGVWIRKLPVRPEPQLDLSLKIYGMKTFKSWVDKYGEGYEALLVAHHCLLNEKGLDYKNLSVESAVEKEKREAKQRRDEQRAAEKAAVVESQYKEVKEEMEKILVETDNALRILVPVFEDDPYDAEKEEPKAPYDKNLHGYNTNESITIHLKEVVPNVKVSKDNEDVVQVVRDCKISLDGHIKTLNKWLMYLVKGDSSADLIKQLVSLKSKMDGLCQKIDELKLPKMNPTRKALESSDDDSDLEDVPEKEVEDFVAPYEVPEYIMKGIARNEAGPSSAILGTSSNRTTAQLEMSKETSKNSNKRSLNSSDKESLSDQEKVCRAPLGDHLLCPRKDLKKCPFHGVIVERDDSGVPLKQEPFSLQAERAKIPRAELTGSYCLDDDEEYIRDLEAGTGKSFSFKGKKTVNQVSSGQATRNRLTKKLLNKRTVRRI
ncbi:unnamed protein product [Auanema sp. JU1783]|nr:unnamed protein product [Auanema sp. JU1783]